MRTLSDQIFDQLRQRIVMHEISPGDAIRPDEIGVEFSTSKIPVREALARLEGVGMVQSIPNRGFIARPLALDELEDLYSLRRTLEPTLASMSAKNASEQKRSEVEEAFVKITSTADWKSIVDARRSMILLMLVDESKHFSSNLLIQLFDLSERYHKEHISKDFIDLSGLEELLYNWLKRDTDRVEFHYKARLEARYKLALASMTGGKTH